MIVTRYKRLNTFLHSKHQVGMRRPPPSFRAGDLLTGATHMVGKFRSLFDRFTPGVVTRISGCE